MAGRWVRMGKIGMVKISVVTLGGYASAEALHLLELLETGRNGLPQLLLLPLIVRSEVILPYLPPPKLKQISAWTHLHIFLLLPFPRSHQEPPISH